MFIRISFFILFLCISTAYAKTVVTTLPEFAWVVKELTSKVDVDSYLEGTEDPHFVDASPSFIFKAAKADLVIFNGMELEVGWLPKVVQMSGNAKVQPGGKGYCNASSFVSKIEALDKYDRSMGDVHPQGNPHYTLSILRMKEVARGISDCLEKIGVKVGKNLEKLNNKFQKTYDEIKVKLKPGTFYVYHREFNYLAGDYGYVFKQSLEKVPGVLPSANYLVKMAKQSKKDKPQSVLAGATAPKKILQKFQELSGIKYKMLNLHPKKDQDYIEFIQKFMMELN